MLAEGAAEGLEGCGRLAEVQQAEHDANENEGGTYPEGEGNGFPEEENAENGGGERLHRMCT